MLEQHSKAMLRACSPLPFLLSVSLSLSFSLTLPLPLFLPLFLSFAACFNARISDEELLEFLPSDFVSQAMLLPGITSHLGYGELIPFWLMSLWLDFAWYKLKDCVSRVYWEPHACPWTKCYANHSPLPLPLPFSFTSQDSVLNVAAQNILLWLKPCNNRASEEEREYSTAMVFPHLTTPEVT